MNAIPKKIESSNALKVLHIGKYFPPYTGGMETYLRDLMVAQSKQGMICEALVHQSAISLRSMRDTYVVAGQKIAVTRVAVWLRLLFTPLSPAFPWLLARLIKKTSPDLLHLHMPNVSAFWALLLPSARRLPWVIHWHADVLASPHSLGLRMFYTIYRRFERKVLIRSRGVIVTSPPYLASSQPLIDFRRKCHVVPLGLDPGNLPRVVVKDSLSGHHGPLRVLAIGRLTYYKGFEYLIKAVANCNDVEVHLVGQGGEEKRLKSLVKSLGLQTRVTFYGYLPGPALAERFADCDCLCLPSIERTEAFGLVLLEAMYYGMPVVVSDVAGSGMGWVVDDNVTGLHVAPGDIGGLSDALDAMQRNRNILKSLGKNGRQKFCGEFHIDKSAAGVAEVYKQILAPPLDRCVRVQK